jgi:hypothetical protein
LSQAVKSKAVSVRAPRLARVIRMVKVLRIKGVS